jgi:hypothetical protein
MGLLDNFWDTIGNVGSVASKTAEGRALGRKSEAELAQEQDKIAVQRYLAGLQGANTDLNQRKFALGAPGIRAGTAVRGDVLANAQDAGVQGPIVGTHGNIPTITGGLRPSILSSDTRALGSQLSRDALLQQMKGDTFAPTAALPPTTPLPKPNALDSLLSGGGLAGNLLKAALGNGGGSGGNIPLEKIGAALKHLFGGGRSQDDTGPTSIPGGSTDFNDWTANTGSFNPESPTSLDDLDPTQLPGYVDPMDEYLRWLDRQGGGGGDSQLLDVGGDYE